mgnify:CR=1 FL=1
MCFSTAWGGAPDLAPILTSRPSWLSLLSNASTGEGLCPLAPASSAASSATVSSSANKHDHTLNESLLLVWTPSGQSRGEIYRLDAMKVRATVRLYNHTEETLQHLYDVHSAAVGVDAGLGAMCDVIAQTRADNAGGVSIKKYSK